MSESQLLTGKVAIVTGASAGIGRATARALAAAGAHVVVTARRSDRLDSLVAEIHGSGGSATARASDVATLSDVQSVVDATVDQSGRVDILVNNAGIMKIASITENDVDDWTAMVDVNIKGVLHFLSAIMPHMIERGSGHIVSV